ncbi:PEP-CTERM sorting domain-containing protein [Amaricoccus sp. B4]|uniref:PEP-CTERM sorting domain-containing protein n=1 Tax=Amaricoccus sp. B4 TaxID=3368557 RepID=UPI00370FC571
MKLYSGMLLPAVLLAGAVSLTPATASALSFGGFGGDHGISIDFKGGFGKGESKGEHKGWDKGPLADLFNGKGPRGHGGGHGGHGGDKPAPVPLPATLPLLLGGIGLIGAAKRRRAAR